MEETNSMIIKKIYLDYFEIIDSYFGSIKHYLGIEKESHIDLGIFMAKYPLISDLILDSLDDLDIEIDKFWKTHAQTVFDYIKIQDTLKCVYSGDITPVILEDFIKKSSMYVDSIIISDPVFNLAYLHKKIISDKKYYLQKLIRHVFNIWKLKDLIISDSKENIIFVIPINLQSVNYEEKSILADRANLSFTNYMSSITARSFSDSEEILSLFETFQNNECVYKNIKNHKLLPAIIQDLSDFSKFLDRFHETGKFSQFKEKSRGWNFGLYIQSQFARVQEHKYFCNKLIAEPIYDYELPWFFFNHEIGCNGIDEAIINSLQRDAFQWICNIPISAIKTLREEEKLDYMRSLLRRSVTDLKAKNDKDLISVSEQIEKNFLEAFNKQKSELRSLRKDVKNILNKEIPITAVGLIAGFVPYLGNVVSLTTAGRDIKSHLEKLEYTHQNIVSKESDFINLLMNSHDGRRKTN